MNYEQLKAIMASELDGKNEKHFTINGYEVSICRSYGAEHLCGYVVIPKGHKYHGKYYSSIPIRCHGGLTYSDKAEDSDGWEIGFDCGHFDDISPFFLKTFGEPQYDPVLPQTYKDEAFVTKELKYIVEQLEAEECQTEGKKSL